MTVSPARLLPALILALFFAATALAQDDAGAPVQLPGVDDSEAETASEPAPGDAPLRVPTRPGARDMAIEVGVISGQAPVVGTLSGTSGLGGDIWEGSSATQARILLNQISVGAPSRAMSGLLRRLLLTASYPPRDSRGGDPIITLRIERAWEAGFLEAIPTMIQQATQLAGDQEMETLRAETLLLAGGGDAACGNATPLRMESQDPFWMKLRAYCFQHQGLVPAARLTADLLYDTGDEDELYQVLLEWLTGDEAANVGRALREFDAPLSPLHFVMLRDAGLAPSAAGASMQSLSIARAMASGLNWHSDEGIAFALSSAEMAALAGALSSAELLAVYETSAAFDPDQRTRQLGAASGTNSAATRALFAEAVVVDSISGTRAETLSAALSLAAKSEFDLTYAAVLGRGARSLAPEEVLSWAAFDIALAALADGNLSDAYDWFDIMSASGLPSARQVQSLRAALTMAAPSERFAFWPVHALQWLEQADLGEYSYARVTAQLMLFDAMGYAIPDEARMRLTLHEDTLEGQTPPAVMVENLQEAAQAGRIGETVAASLVVIGPGGPRAAHPVALAEAIRALRQVGLEEDARTLATEALLGFALEDVE